MKLFKNPIIPILVIVILTSMNTYPQKDYAKYVNPFVGTGGHGHTFPGATVPFGFVQLSPDTRIDNWDGSSGYHYSDNVIYGFSMTHLSGTGIPDYCDILLTPTTGETPTYDIKATFSHANEKAEPGFYSVKLDNGITAEMTATARVGLHRYTFPKSGEDKLILDLGWRDHTLDSSFRMVGKNRIEGFRRSSSWAKDQVVFFVAEFSKPFSNVEFREGASTQNKPEMKTTKHLKGVFYFNKKEGEKILVKIGISPVSIEGARQNLAAEMPGWDFEKVRSNAKTEWNKELSKIEAIGGTPAQITNFYTALYHTMIAPNIFQDVDGKYLGLDRKVHTAEKDTNYTIFSLWDTFRAAHPLYSIIDEKRTANFINTFIRQYEQGGKLPVWELAGNETDTMIGYHAVSVIADAMAKGIGGFDYEKAYEASKHSSELDERGRKEQREMGFISMEREGESVSKSLEYAYNDFCVAVIARVLYEKALARERGAAQSKNGETAKSMQYLADYKIHLERAQFYKNLFDRKSGFMRPRQNGGFIERFSPEEVTFHFTEGNSWVYTFFVPQDVSGLIDLMGGKNKLGEKLDELFTTDVQLSGRKQPDITGLIGQYAHGNEPSHHIAYLFDYADQPWKTQKYVRQILDEFYKPEPDGLIGNEDCGQMSAWYILSAAGFYPVAPGSNRYELGSPIFKQVKFHLENGKTFSVSAPSNSAENVYVKYAKLNGKRLDRSVITHQDIADGGTLEFELVNSPVYDAFQPLVSNAELTTNRKINNLVASPIIESGNRSKIFVSSEKISISAIDPNQRIYYTLDGTNPNENSSRYLKPFEITKNTNVKAIAVSEDGFVSLPVSAVFNKLPNDWAVKLNAKPDRQYSGVGPEGLIDGIRGGENFASGEWQGFQGQNFEAIIDLKSEKEIRTLGGGFLQAARSWIFMPVIIEFEVSLDGETFKKVAEIETSFPERELNHAIHDYVKNIDPIKARFVRVRAKNFGKLPEWHSGAGYDAYVFVDEIIIK